MWRASPALSMSRSAISTQGSVDPYRASIRKSPRAYFFCMTPEGRPIAFHDVCALRDRRSSLAAQPESVLQSAARNTGDGQRVSLVMGVHDDAVEVGFVAQYLEAGESAPVVADEECLDEIAWANALRSTVLFSDRFSLFEVKSAEKSLPAQSSRPPPKPSCFSK